MTESVHTLNSEDSSACWIMTSIISWAPSTEGGRERGIEREGGRERGREREEGRREGGTESITAYLLVYANSQNLEIEAHTC